MSGAGSTTDMSGNKGSSIEKENNIDNKSDENKISESNNKEKNQSSTTSLSNDNNMIDKNSKENNNSVNKAKFTMDRIRLESIEQDKLMAFLEKNDLENGHEFNISVLMSEKQRRATPAPQTQQSQQQVPQQSQSGQQSQVLATDKASGPQQVSALQKDEQSQLTDPTSNINSELEAKQIASLANGRPLVTDKPSQEDNNSQSTSEPPKKLQKLSNGTDTSEGQANTNEQQQQSQEQKQITQTNETQQPAVPYSFGEIKTKRHVESMEGEAPTLSTMIQSYVNNPRVIRSNEKTKLDLDYEKLDEDKLLVMMLPEKRPHKVPETTSLPEIYYHQQTLPMAKLFIRAHKALTTESYEATLVEGKIAVLYSRMEELKRRHNWSLRQPKRYVDPFVKATKTHWDFLLSEMKWLSTDFREHRKYKMVQCAYIAQAVTDYWNYGKVCCIVPKPIHFLEDDEIPQTFSNDFSTLSPIESGAAPFTISSSTATTANTTNDSKKDNDNDTVMVDEAAVDTTTGDAQTDKKEVDSLRKDEDDQIKVEDNEESKDKITKGDIENKDKAIIEEDEKSIEINEKDGSVDEIEKEKMEVDDDPSNESDNKSNDDAEIESSNKEKDEKDTEEKEATEEATEEETTETKEIADNEVIGKGIEDNNRGEKDPSENEKDSSSTDKSSTIIKPIDNKTIDISKLLERPDPKTEIVPKSLPEFSKEEFLRIQNFT
ncbi:unnamed protein product [[Candida] boidinii]|uniref:Unnamed protein product n=1 Tax=Candida boidinii TaxID=5477 RepID=A0ACB5TF76_CANBO|nr:unnamed protein product [[Candida] boidinii]